MCQISNLKPQTATLKFYSHQKLMVGDEGALLDFTRTPTMKVQCQHQNGQWQDTPELKPQETLYCQPGSVLRMVPNVN
jgi:hypothetical protein